MAQRDSVLSKHYYRRWFFGMTLCPAYRFFYEKDKKSRFKRFNSTAEHFNFFEVLEIGFDKWWENNQIRLQSEIKTSKLLNLEIQPSYSRKEIDRYLSNARIDFINGLDSEEIELSNLTIIDSSSGKDHKELDFIDKIISTRVIKFIKEIGGIKENGESSLKVFQNLKFKEIFGLVDPEKIFNSNNPINNMENRISEWNLDFYRIFWYSQLGYFYYDCDSAKSMKSLELRTPNFSKGDLNKSQAIFFDGKDKNDFYDFIEPSGKQFFSSEILIKIINAFCPGTLSSSKDCLLDRLKRIRNNSLESRSDTFQENDSQKHFLYFPEDSNYADIAFGNSEMWHEMKIHLKALFSQNFQEKLKAGDEIAKIFLSHTESTDTISSIDPLKLKVISEFLPFLFQEDKSLGRKGHGSLTILWEKRPNLFIEIDDPFFGTCILIRND